MAEVQYLTVGGNRLTVGGNYLMITAVGASLNYGFISDEVELFCEAEALGLTDGANVTSFTDQSINQRHLIASSSYPTLQTNEINTTKDVVRFSASNPLKYTGAITFRSGWILAKYDAGATFPDTADGYKGLLSGIAANAILSGKRNSELFQDQGFDYFEFRSNDRIYSEDDDGVHEPPAPMQAYKLIFFRFWTTLTLDGVQLGQELANTNRKWSGDVALVILSNQDLCESDIRDHSEQIAAAYGLTLADVFPYQADKRGKNSIVQLVNYYDPPGGSRIAEVIDDPKQVMELSFTIRSVAEFKAARAFYRDHFPEVAFLYRNYDITPPEDTEGYFTSEFEAEGADQNFSYGFAFREK
jgi:hypothetical protein